MNKLIVISGADAYNTTNFIIILHLRKKWKLESTFFTLPNVLHYWTTFQTEKGRQKHITNRCILKIPISYKYRQITRRIEVSFYYPIQIQSLINLKKSIFHSSIIDSPVPSSWKNRTSYQHISHYTTQITRPKSFWAKAT